MGKFIDAILGRPATPPPMFTGNSAATEGQPVPVAYAHEPVSPLSASLDNKAAVGAWPTILDSLYVKLINKGWQKSTLVEVRAENVEGNYGNETSKALFGFNWRAFIGVGNYANEGFSNPYVPEYNELTPISWGLRVPNSNTPTNTTQQKGSITVQTKPATWEGANTASLLRTGITLQ